MDKKEIVKIAIISLSIACFNILCYYKGYIEGHHVGFVDGYQFAKHAINTD